MPSSRKVSLCLAALAVLLSAVPAARGAVLNSPTATVSINAPLTESLSVSASAGTVNVALLPNGPAIGTPTLTITSTWVLSPTRTSVTTYAYFASSTAALTDGAGDNIPSSALKGSVNGGANTAFTGTSPFAASSSITIFTTAISGANKNSSHSDTLQLTVDTTGLGLPAATYTGTLTIQAQAI